MGVLITAIVQGVLWSSISLGLFISFRILNIADMTTEGSYPLGAGVCVVLIHMGVDPISATIISVLAGMISGVITGFLISVCKIPSLLSGILVGTSLLSINLRIMNRPNFPLANSKTLLDTPFIQEVGAFCFPFLHRKDSSALFLGLIVFVIIILFMHFFFSTYVGQCIIATGDNQKMASSLGINTRIMTVFGLALANGIIALSGAILAQNNGYADVNSGLGVIVVALAAIIVSEVIFSRVSFLNRLICILIGAVCYRLLLVLTLKLNFLKTSDFKLISALFIALFLVIPELKRKYFEKIK